MATFNGEPFLDQQLASLAAQAELPAELVVGDDGSSDATVAILERFRSKAPFPVRIICRPKRLGPGQNFLETAALCEEEWISFCDQDDVWLPHKLAEAARVITQEDVLLVNQRALLCDEHLTVRDPRPFPFGGPTGRFSRPRMHLPLVWTGALMTVRADLVRNWDWDLRPPETMAELGWATGEKIGHGRWLFLLAAALGAYAVTESPAARYRRHSGALTGQYASAPRTVRGVARRNGDALPLVAEFAAKASVALTRLVDSARREDGERLRRASRLYHAAEAALRARATCYEGSPSVRVGALVEALRRNAYFGPPLYAAGVKGLAKDCAAAFGILP